MGEEDLETKPRLRGRPRKNRLAELNDVKDVKKAKGRPKNELWGREYFSSRKKVQNAEAEEKINNGEQYIEQTLRDYVEEKSLGQTENSSIKGNNKSEGLEMTVLTSIPPDSQRERWRLRSMWQLASILNFLHVFRPVLKITLEFSAEELETALITPNNTLSHLHIQLLKGIPPVSKTLGSETWVSVLCKRLSEWWRWVAEGQMPLTANRGEEINAYRQLDPCARVLMLKALCEIRAEQDDIWKFVDCTLKSNKTLSTFRKERFGGDSHGTIYWYDADSVIGHRLYREIQKIEAKLKPKGKGRTAEPLFNCQWETVATNLDEFQTVSEKLISSRIKMEAAIGKKVQNDIIPVLEELHKKKERLLKRQQRQAMLLDNYFIAQDGSGRSRRDRKPVKYTFDDYDRSIEEAIQITKRGRSNSDNHHGRDATVEQIDANGYENGHFGNTGNMLLANKDSSLEANAENPPGRATRSNRLRERDKRNTGKISVDSSDNDAGSKGLKVTENDIGSTSIDRERGLSSSPSEDDELEEDYKEDDGDEEYKEDDGDEEYREDEEDLDEDDISDDSGINYESSDDSFQRRHSTRRSKRQRIHIDSEDDVSISDDESEEERRYPTRRKKPSTSKQKHGLSQSYSEDDASISDDYVRDEEERYAMRRKKPSRSKQQPALRRSKRAARVDYSKYELSEEEDSIQFEFQTKPKSRKKLLSEESEAEISDDRGTESGSSASKRDGSNQEKEEGKHETNDSNVPLHQEAREEPVIRSWEQLGERSLDLRNQHFIDLNEAAPVAGFDDDLNMVDQTTLQHQSYLEIQDSKSNQ
eukprot:TRINITY_DN2023_c0_g1_i1.p1 TRINITY_DN2023_c0_g1~~TRINITY_DN2023_c0_g1_i1.p1  ORF type:complete len:815 (+),score=225.17 TRINITY_DN2023_c0_g1_i1:393-2837(+)